MRGAFRVAACVHMSLRRGATLGDIGSLTSSHRAALQNSKAMSSHTLQTTLQRLLRIQLIPMVKLMPKTLACMFNNQNSPRTTRRLSCN